MLTAKKTSDERQELNRAIQSFISKLDNVDLPMDLSTLTYAGFFERKMLVINVIREGLSFKLFEKIKAYNPFTEEEWADYLGLSTKTLQRYKKEKDFRFKAIHSEKILELAETINFGKIVFESPKKFYRWLQTPSYALNNLTPAELLKDSYGKDLVMAELNCIEHGIFA